MEKRKFDNEKFRELYKSSGNTTARRAWVLNLAELTNRMPSTIKQWLQGISQPTPKTAELVARELGVSAEELFAGVLRNKYTGRKAKSHE